MMSVPRNCAQNQLFPFALILILAMQAWGQTQRDEVLRDRLAKNLHRIETASEWGATKKQLGTVWLQMAYDYQAQLETQLCENAYSQALRLLAASEAQMYYAAALDGLSSVYLATERLPEALNLERKALAVYERIADGHGVAQMHISIGITMLHLKQYKESEREVSEGLQEIEQQEQPDESERISALVTNSYDKCFQKRCVEALVDSERAIDLARAKFARDALEVITSLEARAFDLWKSGSEAEGERSMLEAIRLLDEKKDLSSAMLNDSRLRLYQQYWAHLKETHQKTKEQQIESEIARLKGGERPHCKDCTVNVAGFLSNSGRE